MSAENWTAIIGVLTAAGGGLSYFFKVIVAAVRTLVDEQRATTAAISEVKLELVALRTRVDTVLEFAAPRDSVSDPRVPLGTLSLSRRKD